MDLKLILYIVVFALLGVTVCVLLGYFGVYPFTMVTETIKGWLTGFDLQGVVENPASLTTTAVGIAGTAASVGSLAMSKINQAKQAKEQLQQVATQTQTKLSSVTTELEGTTSKLQSTELNLSNATTKISELTASSKDWETKAATYKEQLDKLQNHYTELQKLKAADVIGSLPAGTVISNPDGSKTAVIEKVVVK